MRLSEVSAKTLLRCPKNSELMSSTSAGLSSKKMTLRDRMWESRILSVAIDISLGMTLILCSTKWWKDKKTRKTVFEPYLVKEIHGLKVGIIGLMTQSVPPMLNEIRGYFVEDPAKAATDSINGALLDCDIIIALAHMDHSEIESFAQKVPKISIIIGGHNRSYMDAKMVNRSLWVQTDAFGFQIGRLDVRWVKGSSDFQYENVLTVLHPEMKADPQVEEMITSSGDILKRPLP